MSSYDVYFLFFLMPDTIWRYTSIESLLLTILAVIVLAIFVWAIYSFVRAIWLFIFSNWEEEKVKGARNSIRYMMIGIIFTVLLLFIVPLLLEYLGINCAAWVSCADAFSPSRIFERISTLLSNWRTIGRNYQQDVWLPGIQWSWPTPSTSDYNL